MDTPSVKKQKQHTMFSWRKDSVEIFRQIHARSSIDDTAIESDSDDEDLNPTSQYSCNMDKFDERRYSNRPFDEEFDRNLKRWAELTNIDMGPFANTMRHMTIEDAIKETKKDEIPEPVVAIQKQVYPEYFDNEGTVTFKFQHLIISERLKVTILGVNNLFPNSSVLSDNEMETYVTVCLMPCKVQQKRTQVVTRTRNPEFKSVLYFSGMSLQEMHQMSIRVIVFGKERSADRFKNIGEVTVSLEVFDLTAENVLHEYVNTRIWSHPGGSGVSRIRLVR